MVNKLKKADIVLTIINIIYIDTTEFNTFEQVTLAAFVYKGDHFNEDFIYYGETSEEPIESSYVTLTNTQSNFEYKNCLNCYDANYFSYFFKKPKTTERYLIMAAP